MRSKPLLAIFGSLVFTVAAQSADKEGTLVIVGGGRLTNEVRDEFFRVAGGKGHARLIIVPTASEAADTPSQHDALLAPWRALHPLEVAILHTRDRQQADDPSFVQPLRTATGVWLSGGDQNRLIAAYRGTLFERELHKLLERGGTIGGTSAGAAVMSDLMIQGGNPHARTGSGFGFIKGIVIDQHFVARNRIARLRGVLDAYRNYAGLGVDEGTAVIIRGTRLTVKGDSTVTVIWPTSSSQPRKEETLKNGHTFDLSSLQIK